MADSDQDGAQRDTDELRYTDLDDKTSALHSSRLRLDHCDLLLDALDAQLDQLQVQPQKRQAISGESDCSDPAPLRWSQSLSKDTGLGSTTQTNDTPMSYLDLVHTPMTEKASGRSAGCWEDPVTQEENKRRREQIIWRLERLLGDTSNDGRMVGEAHPPSDSICTEDFARRFRDEMVELTLPESDTERLDKEEEAEITDCDTCQPGRNEQRVVNADGKGPRERHETPQRTGDFGSTCRRAEVVTEPESLQQVSNPSTKARTLAGVPVWTFDTVSIDSDLDSVSTEQVRQHIHRRSGWRSLIDSVSNIDQHEINQSDYDTPTQEEIDPRATSGQRSSYGKGQSAQKSQHNKKGAYRLVCSMDDKDTDEELNHRSRRCRPERTLEKMRDRLSTLQQRREKEEETLQLKKTLIKDAERSLCELQRRRKHASEELERLTAEKAKMEKDKTTLGFVQRDDRTGTDSVSSQQPELQRQGGSCISEPSVVMSVLERDGMDRQLHRAKTELFAEQRRAREKLESIQEKLEETHEELQMVTVAESSMRSRCAYLEEKQRREKDQMEAVEAKVGELQSALGECMIKRGDLERILTQKERQQMETQHCSALKEAQEQTQRLIEKETQKLRDFLEQQKQEAKSREAELHVEALEKAKKAMEKDRKKWEEANMEAVQVLEEQNTQRMESMWSEVQRETIKALALQHTVGELKTRVQELESESCLQQREHESLLAVICKSLREEHQAELQRLQKQMAQDSQKMVLELEEAVQRAQKEADRLRVMLVERESSHNQTSAEMDQRLHHWAQELGAECQNLHLLVKQTGAKENSVHLPPSLTIPEALTTLRTLGEQLKSTISHLHQELDSQKQTTEHIRNQKEQELRIQMQQLRTERDQDLQSLQQRLIQEHIEELSSLKWAHLCDGGAEGAGGVVMSLRKQLKAKDMELRLVRRGMGRWKEQTAARLACSFEEELTAELERKTSKAQEEGQTKGDMSLSAKEPQSSLCSPSLHVSSFFSSSDMASYKLLRYLQSRVKQLRLDDQACSWSSLPSKPAPLDLSGSYLKTINKGQDIAVSQSHSSIRTVQS